MFYGALRSKLTDYDDRRKEDKKMAHNNKNGEQYTDEQKWKPVRPVRDRDTSADHVQPAAASSSCSASSLSSSSLTSDSEEAVARQQREAIAHLCWGGGSGGAEEEEQIFTKKSKPMPSDFSVFPNGDNQNPRYHRSKRKHRRKGRREGATCAYLPAFFSSQNSPFAALCLIGLGTFLLLIAAAFYFLPSSTDKSLAAEWPSSVHRAYNSTKALSIVDALCSEWRQGRYAGDFCASLCAGDRNWTMTDYVRGGHKHVLRLHYDNKDVILKMTHPFAQDYDQQVDFSAVDEETFADMLLEIVNNQLQLGWPRRYKHHLVTKLWPSKMRRDKEMEIEDENGQKIRRKTKKLSEADMRSLWALVQQDEFVNSALLATASRVIPKLLGVCGHAYRVEYLIPFRMKPYYLNLKAKILVHLHGTLKQFHDFLNDPLQWCDVKFDNLGLSADYPKRFVVMDSDMLFTESRLDNMLRAQRCTNDSQCGLFDCAARCNRTSGQCSGRTNDNIDVFCKKLVVGQLFGSFWSKSNRYLSACHVPEPANLTQRLNELRLVWAWTLSDI